LVNWEWELVVGNEEKPLKAYGKVFKKSARLREAGYA
jgi:hypothetical protein